MIVLANIKAAFVPIHVSVSSSVSSFCTRTQAVSPLRKRKDIACSKKLVEDAHLMRSHVEGSHFASGPVPIPGGQDTKETSLDTGSDTVVEENTGNEHGENQISADAVSHNSETELEEEFVVSDEETVSSNKGKFTEHFLYSATLQEYREEREAGLLPPVLTSLHTEWSDAWALALTERKGRELMNQYSRVGILIERNFSDFEPAPNCEEAFNIAPIEDIAIAKAKAVYDATGLPAISETHDLSIDAPESGSRINKTLQQGYYTRNVAEEADAIINRVRPISDENRMTRFKSVVAYFDGEIEVITSRTANVAIVFSGSHCATVATAAALDDMYQELTRRLGLTLENPGRMRTGQDGEEEGENGKVLVGATLLKERILRDGKMLGDSIIKVSSFLNHMVDTELVEVCGEELAERLRHTMPNKVLTVESTGLIAGLPTARKLGIPLVFARKSRPITISDSYQTTYRSATKGTTNELLVSCEYLEAGDRVLIIDDFLAGGSTAEALFKLAKMAHAKVVGVGVLIEKMSDGGRTFLSGYDVPVESLAKLLPDGDKGRISFVEEGPWIPPTARIDKRRAQEKAISAEAEYYSRTGSIAMGHSESDSSSNDDDDDDDDGGVDVIRWEDDDEDVLDAMEENLIREIGKV